MERILHGRATTITHTHSATTLSRHSHRQPPGAPQSSMLGYIPAGLRSCKIFPLAGGSHVRQPLPILKSGGSRGRSTRGPAASTNLPACHAILSPSTVPQHVCCVGWCCVDRVCVCACVCVQRVRHGTGYLLLPSLFFSALGHKLHGSLSALRSAGAGLHPPAYTKGEPAPCLCECNVSSVPVCEKIGARSVPVRCPLGARCKKNRCPLNFKMKRV